MKTKSFLLAVAFATMAFTFSCSSDDGGGNSIASCPNPSVSGNSLSCGDKTYKTVAIGNQTWMAENLDYAVEGSKCYDEDEANCDTYGRLYDWETAKKICPSGWHLPSTADWDMMTNHIGGSETEGKKLKTASWGGTNDYGFSALPGGFCYFVDGSFKNVGYGGYWWSSSEYKDNNRAASSRSMGNSVDYAYWNNNNKGYLFSVRCLQD